MATSASSWQDFEDKLIDFVWEYPVLHDCTLKEYRNNIVKNNPWKAVAASNFLHPKSVSMSSASTMQSLVYQKRNQHTPTRCNIHAFKTQNTVAVVHRVCDVFFLFLHCVHHLRWVRFCVNCIACICSCICVWCICICINCVACIRCMCVNCVAYIACNPW